MGETNAMTESADVIAAVKKALKARRMTYAELAKPLGMSESGVKKLLAGGSCSLGRLLAICEAIGVSLEDLAREATAAPRSGEVAVLTPKQEDFFLENPKFFFFLWELTGNDFDAAAVARAHGLDARALRVYLTTLQALGCVRVLRDGRVRDAQGFRKGLLMTHRLAQLTTRPQQDAMLRIARTPPSKGVDPGDPLSGRRPWVSGPSLLRLREDSVRELKETLRGLAMEFERRARREAAFAREEDCVDIGAMMVVAPFKLSDAVSLQDPVVKRRAKRRR
jgi:DNA-binding Xre family transcriptional regulator